MAPPITSSNTPPSLDPNQDISPTAYITLFSLGSVVLILVVVIACYNIFRTRQTFDHRFGLSNEKQGLGEAIVASYPKMSFSQVKNKYGNTSSDQNLGLCCSICLADFKEVDMVLLLPNCGHFFHVKCVDPWLRLHATCPLCRNSPVLIPPDTSLETQEER